MGDGSQPAINFYYMAFFVKLFNIDHAVFALRFSNSLWAISVLVVFFLLLKNKTSEMLSLFITIMMGTSIWFMNFARNGWFNLGCVFFGLLMIYFLEIGLKKINSKYLLLSGLFAGVACYGYFSGKIFPVAAFLFLFSQRKYFKFGLFFLVSFLITIIPLLFQISSHPDVYFRRASTTFIGNQSSQENVSKMIFDQVEKTISGVIFFQKNVVGQGTENSRYYPVKTPLLNSLTKILFWFCLLFALVRRVTIKIWLLVYALTIAIGFATIDTPNSARLITILPCIFFIIGSSLNNAYNLINNKWVKNILLSSLFITYLCFLVKDQNLYWQWALSEELARARQPAIEYSEFISWQSYQIKIINKGYDPITNYEWYNLRNTILK
jgi:hypothetical protein